MNGEVFDVRALHMFVARHQCDGSHPFTPHGNASSAELGSFPSNQWSSSEVTQVGYLTAASTSQVLAMAVQARY